MFRSRVLAAAAAIAGLAAAPSASACGAQDNICKAVSVCYGVSYPGWATATDTSCTTGSSDVCVAFMWGISVPYYVACTPELQSAQATTLRPTDDAGLPSEAEIAALSTRTAPFAGPSGQADDWTAAYGLPPRTADTKTPTTNPVPSGGAK